MSTTKYKHKEGRGSLFKNSYKEKDTQPDLKGTMTDLDGKEFEISAWEGTFFFILLVNLPSFFNQIKSNHASRSNNIPEHKRNRNTIY